MSERPLPRKWSERLLERVADAAKLTPKIKVEPKGPRSSGSFPAGAVWHTPIGQAEMQAEVDGLLSKERCAGCGTRVILGTGDLIQGLWCGSCWGRREADEPPNAA